MLYVLHELLHSVNVVVKYVLLLVGEVGRGLHVIGKVDKLLDDIKENITQLWSRLGLRDGSVTIL